MSTGVRLATSSAAGRAENAPGTGYGRLFVIGCPRSGTTWMQLLLSQIPSMATAPETQIFAYYLDHFLRQWRHEHEGPGRATQGRAGLSRLLSEADFEELCRVTASLVLDRIAATNPGCDFVVEKSPRHALQTEFIHRVFPDAWFLHVVRDPRDTAASLMAAAKSWAGGWAPHNAIEAARMWKDHIERARRVAPVTDRYREIRYERLREDSAGELQSVLEWLGVDVDSAACRAAAEACEFGRLQRTGDGSSLPLPGEKSPRDFFRSGSVGGWQRDLTRGEVRIIEHICGALMDELAYERAFPARARGPLRIAVHDAIQRVRESIDWQLAKLLLRV